MHDRPLIRLTISEVDADDIHIWNDQTNSESAATDEIPVELVFHIPRGPDIAERRELDSIVVVESLERMVAHFQQVEPILQRIQPLVLAISGIDIPSAQR